MSATRWDWRRLVARLPFLRGLVEQREASRRRITDEIDAEIAFHLHMRRSEYETSGMSPEDAAGATRRRFGSRARARAEGIAIRASHRPPEQSLLRRLRSLPLEFGHTVAQALRSLRAAPMFSCAVILTLALGIGANTAAFTVVSGVLLRPLPYEKPERLIYISRARPEALRALAGAGSLAALASHGIKGVALIAPSGPSRVRTLPVGDGFFELFGVAPAVGRGLDSGDFVPGAEAAVVLTDHLARRELGRPEDAIGTSLQFGEHIYVVVGVMPPGTNLARYQVDAWLPASNQDELRFGLAAARLAAGATLEQARGEIEAIAQQVHEEDARPDAGPSDFRLPLVATMHESVIGGAGDGLLVLATTAVLVLLIACANVANLLLTRANSRMPEFAVRSALGAGRGRLVAQLMAESALLATVGALLGSLVAPWATHSLLHARGYPLPKSGQVQFDTWILAFTLAVALACGLLAALPVVLNLPGTGLANGLRGGGSVESRGPRRIRELLVIGEVAVAVVLLAGTGLLLRTFVNVMPTEPGFAWQDKLALRIELPESRYPDGESWLQLVDQLREDLGRLPGVRAVSATTELPMTGLVSPFFPETSTNVGPESWPRYLLHRAVTAGYLESMRMPIQRGRTLASGDNRNTERVAVLNETAASRLWPDGDAVGKIVRGRTDLGETEYRIVGVAADGWSFGGTAKPNPEIFVPYLQEPRAEFEMLIEIDRPGQLIRPATEVVRQIDPSLPIISPGRRSRGGRANGIQPMGEVLAAAISTPRYQFAVVAVFATLALMLTTVGIYAVLAHAVVRRTREIGIRMAIGARTSSVLGLVVRQGMRLVAFGLFLGTVVALWATRLLESFLYGVSPSDPATYIGLCFFVVGLGGLACWIPARRATRINPTTALRAP